MKASKHILVVVASIAVILGLAFSFIFSTDNGNPDPAWIHAGAAIALILITWQYVRITHRTLSEAEAARLQSIVPMIVLHSQDVAPRDIPAIEVFLLNTGTGTAVNIECSTTVLFPLNHDALSEDRTLRPEVSSAFQGSPEQMHNTLGPSYGSIENRIGLFLESQRHTPFPALTRGDFGAVVVYEDVLGRGYCTLLYNRQHLFSEIYPSDESHQKRVQKRQALLQQRCGTTELHKLMREHGNNFWKHVLERHIQKEST